MKDIGQQQTVEVKSAAWQKVVAFCLFILLGMLSLSGLLSVLFPQWLPNQSIRSASGLKNAFVFVGLFVMCFLAFYIWWATLKYVLLADEIGIMQSNGFRTVHLRWEEIGSYQWNKRSLP